VPVKHRGHSSDDDVAHLALLESCEQGLEQGHGGIIGAADELLGAMFSPSLDWRYFRLLLGAVRLPAETERAERAHRVECGQGSGSFPPS
jgi:hypothetical protein